MKYKEMNAHQQTAFRIIYQKSTDIIGGLENQAADFDEDTEEYKEAVDDLGNHELLIDAIYEAVMWKGRQGFSKHLRFAGEKFIREHIEKVITKWGY